MTKMEYQAEIDNCTMELRSLMESVKDSSKDINLEEVRTKKAELEEKRSKLEKEMAELNRPEERGAKKMFDAKEWIEAAKEKRSIVIGANGAGQIFQSKTLFKEVADKDDILNKTSFFWGPNAATMIPVLAPLTDPAEYSEGATDVTVDTDASVAVTKLEPKAIATVLPISAEMLTMGLVDLEAELPAIFAKTFNRILHKKMMQGAATGMTGIFVSAASGTTVATGATISNLAKLAVTVAAKDEPYTIVMNPAHYQTILSDSTAGEDVKLYKESLIRDKSIEGVPVVLDNQALSSTSSGAIMVVAAPLGRYCVGIAGDIQIDPIKVKGDTNTYFQATLFANGKQLKNSDLYSIVHA